jgi:PD-(D/E)XK nuclease superfamily protein
VTDFRRRNYGRGHSYYLGERKLDGVTTIISNGLPKPALVNWAARTAAEKAVNEWDQLAELPVAERLKRISKAPDESRNAAAVKGTRIHALADKLANGEEVAVPDELAGHVESCVRFLDEWQAETVHTEAPVYHEKYLYAGTLDLIADIGTDRWLLDFKTSASGAYGDTAFQLAAYRYATHILAGQDEHGDPTTAAMTPVDKCGVIWLRADGYDLYEYTADESVWRQFLYIQQVARAAADSRDYKGDAMVPPVRSN